MKEKTRKPLNDWTIMFYLAGDNNLNDDMTRAVNELTEVTENARGLSEYYADISFVLKFDFQHPLTPTRRYLFTKQKTYSPHHKFPKEEEETDEAIKELIKWSIKNQKAENYFLIISGHGDSWQGRTLLVDENPGDNSSGIMTIKDLRLGIKEGIKKLPALKNQLDIIGFEGCVMNTLEVMHDFKDLAHYWIGSQGSIPNYAWDYRKIAKELIAKQNKVTSEELLNLVSDKVHKYHKEYSFAGRSADISYNNLNKYDDLIKKMNGTLLLLHTSLFFVWLEFIFNPRKYDFINHPIIRVLQTTHWKSQTFMKNQSIDLIDFLDILSKACKNYVINSHKSVKDPKYLTKDAELFNLILKELSVESSDLLTYIKNEKIICGYYSGIEYWFSRGISMFLPWSTLGYLISQKNYDKLEFFKTSSIFKTPKLWLLFIKFILVFTQRPTGQITKFKPSVFDFFSRLSANIMIPPDVDRNKNSVGSIQKDSVADRNKNTPAPVAEILEQIDALTEIPLTPALIKEIKEILKNVDLLKKINLENELKPSELEILIEKICERMLEYLASKNKSLLDVLEGFALHKYGFIDELEDFDKAIDTFSGGGNTRDDQNKTRDGADLYIDLFGRYRNLRVNDLDPDGKFGC